MSKPLAVDLYCGLGGWTSGLMAEGWHVLGFDIERHVYGEHCYPGFLAVQDVTTLHGSQFKGAGLIVASPPCQEFSYMAMPWSRGKAKAAAIRADTTGQMLADLTRLFDACFRIQREACEAAGGHIPMIVENVRGAIPWVGRSRWNFGSFHFWGDVPALMPPVNKRAVLKHGIAHRSDGVTNFHGQKAPGHSMTKGAPKWNMHHSDTVERVGIGVSEGRKGAGAGAGAEWFDGNLCQLSSASPSRKFASAMIAKIPEPLARHIGRTFYP